MSTHSARAVAREKRDMLPSAFIVGHNMGSKISSLTNKHGKYSVERHGEPIKYLWDCTACHRSGSLMVVVGDVRTASENLREAHGNRCALSASLDQLFWFLPCRDDDGSVSSLNGLRNSERVRGLSPPLRRT